METFLKLLDMILRRINLKNTDVIRHIIETLSALIGRHKIGENSRTSTDTYATKIRQSAHQVERFLNTKLPRDMDPYGSSLYDELLVSEIIYSQKPFRLS